MVVRIRMSFEEVSSSKSAFCSDDPPLMSTGRDSFRLGLFSGSAGGFSCGRGVVDVVGSSNTVSFGLSLGGDICGVSLGPLLTK